MAPEVRRLARTPALIGLALAAAGVLAFVHGGASEALGAHPFWSVRIGYIGIGVGLVLSLAAQGLGAGARGRAGMFAILLVAAAATAIYGKAGFAASFAEDRFAGTLWYYGWIGICTALFALIAALIAFALDSGDRGRLS